MRRSPEEVTETELAMLQVLWERERATRRQVTDALYPDGDTAHYATVQKLLERLEAKGFVRHAKDPQGVLVFTHAVGREEFIGRRLRAMAAKLCGGALTPLLMNLVRGSSLTDQELDELAGFIEEQRQKPRPKGRQR
jgi:predicted transcriptional regulator